MKQSSMFALWGVLYIVCAGLGFLPEQAGSVRIFLVIISVTFFVPPAILLLDARRRKDAKTVRILRLLSGASLAITLVLMILNILTAFAGEGVGSFLHVLLVIFSAPMFCSTFWALSLFLWAALFFASLGKSR